MRHRLESWVRDCLGNKEARLLSAEDISKGSGCSVWDCLITTAGVQSHAVLKIYSAQFDDYSKLGPERTVRKHALALDELRRFFIRTPRLLGYTTSEGKAALITEKVHVIPWGKGTRIAAAKALATLHQLSAAQLSPDLRGLIESSTPNRQRTFLALQIAFELDQKVPQWRAENPRLSSQVEQLLEGGEPISTMVTLVHGDYFSVNVLLDPNGVCIIDWDLMALGDPMWDLGFLIGADQGLGPGEVETVIQEYQQCCSVDMDVLSWHKRCWDVGWSLRSLMKKKANVT